MFLTDLPHRLTPSEFCSKVIFLANFFFSLDINLIILVICRLNVAFFSPECTVPDPNWMFLFFFLNQLTLTAETLSVNLHSLFLGGMSWRVLCWMTSLWALYFVANWKWACVCLRALTCACICVCVCVCSGLRFRSTQWAAACPSPPAEAELVTV